MIVTKALEELDVKADLHPELFVNGTDRSRGGEETHGLTSWRETDWSP